MSTFTIPTQPSIPANTLGYETQALIKPTGFREYDARWKLGTELNLLGVQALGHGLAAYLHQNWPHGGTPKVVTGHDYRAYSQSVKQALILGLLAGGVDVYDIGLALTPMAYFGQTALAAQAGSPLAVAMVTASHNENGWTGVKMGLNPPITFGPQELGELKTLTLAGTFTSKSAGTYTYVANFAQTYTAHLTNRPAYSRRLKAVVACGNGTAAAFAPQILEKLGVDVIPMDTTLDYTFPTYNPNPEDMTMLHAMAARVKETGADLALGFDGDGDRCGVVMDNGHEIFADRLGVLLARHLAAQNKNAQFVVDVKSTGLFNTDPVLKNLGATTDYFKTGHSYIKRRTAELKALAGFEKSGHFFFNPPYGLGYDDALVSALMVLDVLEANPGKSISQLAAELPHTYQSPTMSPHCDDETKYDVVKAITEKLQATTTLIGQPVSSVNTVNGARITVADGTWGLIRASSNKPELVVVVESPTSAENRNAMFAELRTLLTGFPQVGEFNQTL